MQNLTHGTPIEDNTKRKNMTWTPNILPRNSCWRAFIFKWYHFRFHITSLHLKWQASELNRTQVAKRGIAHMAGMLQPCKLLIKDMYSSSGRFWPSPWWSRPVWVEWWSSRGGALPPCRCWTLSPCAQSPRSPEGWWPGVRNTCRGHAGPRWGRWPQRPRQPELFSI